MQAIFTILLYDFEFMINTRRGINAQIKGDSRMEIMNIVQDVLLDNRGGFPFWGGGFGYFGIFWLVFFILGILLCIWIYRDANSRGMSGLLWVILMIIGCFFFLGWLLVLIIYLVVRK
jgi:hypothetical protein